MGFFFPARRGQMVTPPNTVCHLALPGPEVAIVGEKTRFTKGGKNPVQMNGGSTFHSLEVCFRS